MCKNEELADHCNALNYQFQYDQESEKLGACWNYVVSNFYYGGPDPNLNSTGWARSEALRNAEQRLRQLLGARFSCTFAALAREVGYSPYMMCGRVPGSRDGAADGYTRHCWVRINGLYYDPEAQYAGWMRVSVWIQLLSHQPSGSERLFFLQ
ncbi:MAG: hypothetical protein ACLUTA_05780 [Blautia wexlerae]